MTVCYSDTVEKEKKKIWDEYVDYMMLGYRFFFFKRKRKHLMENNVPEVVIIISDRNNGQIHDIYDGSISSLSS